MHLPPDLPVCVCGKEPILDIVTRKPVLPTAEGNERNPRSQLKAAHRASAEQRTSAEREPYTARDLYMQSKHERGWAWAQHQRGSIILGVRTERSPRRISVVPGRGARTQTPTLPSNVVFLAKARWSFWWSCRLWAFARIGPMSATISTTAVQPAFQPQISDARSGACAGSVPQSALSNPTRQSSRRASWTWPLLRPPAGRAGIRTSLLPTRSGSLSLSKSVAIAAGSEA